MRLSDTSRIILLCVGAAVLDGEVHDQITARICIEYFTIAHPHVINTTSPTLIALYWASYGVGFLGGVSVMSRALLRRRERQADR